MEVEQKTKTLAAVEPEFTLWEGGQIVNKKFSGWVTLGYHWLCN